MMLKLNISARGQLLVLCLCSLQPRSPIKSDKSLLSKVSAHRFFFLQHKMETWPSHQQRLSQTLMENRQIFLCKYKMPHGWIMTVLNPWLICMFQMNLHPNGGEWLQLLVTMLEQQRCSSEQHLLPVQARKKTPKSDPHPAGLKPLRIKYSTTHQTYVIWKKDSHLHK